jgi:hypothetical protein
MVVLVVPVAAVLNLTIDLQQADLGLVGKVIVAVLALRREPVKTIKVAQVVVGARAQVAELVL